MTPSRRRLVYLLIASTLAILGGAGLFYYFKPPPAHAITWLPQKPLPLKKEVAPNDVDEVGAQPTHRKVTLPEERTAANGKAVLQLPLVEISSPSTGETFEEPANITVIGNVIAGRDPIGKVEFFYTQESVSSDSICNNSAGDLLNSPSVTRIGEAVRPPLHASWNSVSAGTYILFAIATDGAGRRQVSRPKLVIVNKAFDKQKLSGWWPEIDGSESFQQGTDPTRALCPPLSFTQHADVKTEGLPLAFEVGVGSSKDFSAMTFQWAISAGRISAGQGTRGIVVDTAGLQGQSVTATAAVKGPFEGCSEKLSATTKIIRPREFGAFNNVDIDREKEQLKEFGRNLRVRQPDTRPRTTTTAPPRNINRADSTEPFAPLKRLPSRAINAQIIFYNGSSACEGEGLVLAEWAKRYLVERFHIPSKRLTIKDGGYAEDTGLRLKSAEMRLEISQLSFNASNEVHTRQCPLKALAASLAGDIKNQMHRDRSCPDITEDIGFSSLLLAKQRIVNLCGLDSRDPQNTNLQVDLSTSVMGVYGKSLSYKYTTNGGTVAGSGKDVIWYLAKVPPGLYTAVVEVDGACGCTKLATTSVAVTGFCTPCVTVSPQRGIKTLTFTADVEKLVANRDLNYHWRVSAGSVTSGQGTPTITVDTSPLNSDQAVVAMVEVEGLPDACRSTASFRAHVALPPVTVTDLATDGGPKAFFVDRSRPAATRGGQTILLSQPPTPAPKPEGVVESKDKEWITIGWKRTINLGEDVSISVKYDRKTDAIEIHDANGQVKQPLFVLRSIREKWGADYEILAQARLKSAALGCSDWCSDKDYKSLDLQDHVEWSFSKTPTHEGSITFNLELFVKGRPKGNGEPKPEESVWQNTDALTIDIKNPQPAKSMIMPPSILALAFGIVLAFKGINIRGVNIVIGKGDVVGRDKAGGDIVHGDNVGHDKN
jgi:hypothetical protein